MERKINYFILIFILHFCCVQDLKKGIREDPRYTKFSSSEKKCEKEFVAWLKDKTMKARDDYKQLLQVSPLLSDSQFFFFLLFPSLSCCCIDLPLLGPDLVGMN
jgi:hypothetical protein